MKYKVIKSKAQYKTYCDTLEKLVSMRSGSKEIKDEIELLTMLIERWDREHNTFDDMDPIALLRSIMDDHQLKAKDLVKIMGVSKGMVSDILNYKKGLSKEVIRTLAIHFKLGQETFNRTYKLKLPFNSRVRNESVMNTRKTAAA